MSDLKVGELFMLGFRGKTVPDWMRNFASRYGLGGVILLDVDPKTGTGPDNVGTPDELRKLCKDIHDLPSHPLVFIDQEGGTAGTRLTEKEGYKPLVSQEKFSTLQAEQKRKMLFDSYQEMHDLGIDYNLAPVIDINYNPKNPSIGAKGRSYSKDPAIVKENALLAASIAKDAGLGLVLKHFPGIGGATKDSHADIMDVSGSVKDEQENLFYALAPQMPGNAILVSHAYITQWDKNAPSTLSKPILDRVRANAPDTLLVSDDLDMQGLRKVLRAKGVASGQLTQEAALRSIDAGMDMLCITNTIPSEERAMGTIAAAVDRAVDGKRLDKKQVQASIDRVQNRKNAFSFSVMQPMPGENWNIKITPDSRELDLGASF